MPAGFVTRSLMSALLGWIVLGSAMTASAEETRLFEMRTYVTNPGKLPELHKRFREHTNKLFVKHGMELIGYWTLAEGEAEEKDNTLVYILAYPSREAREKSWKAFSDDPEWKAAYEASHKDGVLVKKVEVKFLNPTDYSPIK
ncbi:MAG: NIPSNAP family protein [Pirellulales bacterium]